MAVGFLKPIDGFAGDAFDTAIELDAAEAEARFGQIQFAKHVAEGVIVSFFATVLEQQAFRDEGMREVTGHGAQEEALGLAAGIAAAFGVRKSDGAVEIAVRETIQFVGDHEGDLAGAEAGGENEGDAGKLGGLSDFFGESEVFFVGGDV